MGTANAKLTTMTQVSIDGVIRGNGHASDEGRRNRFERGGWARGKGDDETRAFINETYQRADAFLFGRRTYELFESRVDAKGMTTQIYRPAGRPTYAPAA